MSKEKIKRKIVCLGMAVFFMLSLLSGGTALAQAPKPIELTYCHFVPSVGLMADQYRIWADMLEKRSNGRLKIKWYWSNGLFSMTQALTSVASGVADFGIASGAYFPTQLPTVLALEHAYNSSDVYVGLKAQTMIYKKFPEMEQEFQKNGVLRAAPYGSGTFQFYLKGDWATSADFKGKVGRTMGGGRAVWYEKMGVKPVFMAITDVYEAVERGALWGFENTLSLSSDLKLNEVISTVVPLNSGTVMSTATVMNLKKFKSLSPDLQKIIIDVGVEWAEKSLAKALYEKESTILPAWSKKGVNVVKLKADDLTYIKKTARDAALDLAKKQDIRMGTPGKTEKVLRWLWEYVDREEDIIAAKGHPWK